VNGYLRITATPGTLVMEAVGLKAAASSSAAGAGSSHGGSSSSGGGGSSGTGVDAWVMDCVVLQRGE